MTDFRGYWPSLWEMYPKCTVASFFWVMKVLWILPPRGQDMHCGKVYGVNNWWNFHWVRCFYGQDLANHMGVSKNRDTPKTSISIGFSIVFTIHFGVLYPYFWKHPHWYCLSASPIHEENDLELHHPKKGLWFGRWNTGPGTEWWHAAWTGMCGVFF